MATLHTVIGTVALMLSAWALLDAWCRSSLGFTRAHHSKPVWEMVCGAALVASLLGLGTAIGGGADSGRTSVAGLVVALVGAAMGIGYLCAVRPRVRFYNRCRQLTDLRVERYDAVGSR